MSNRGRRTRATRAKAFVPGSRLGLMAQQIVMKLVLREAFTGCCAGSTAHRAS